MQEDTAKLLDKTFVFLEVTFLWVLSASFSLFAVSLDVIYKKPSFSLCAGVIFSPKIFSQLQNWYVTTRFPKPSATGVTCQDFFGKGETRSPV